MTLYSRPKACANLEGNETFVRTLSIFRWSWSRVIPVAKHDSRSSCPTSTTSTLQGQVSASLVFCCVVIVGGETETGSVASSHLLVATLWRLVSQWVCFGSYALQVIFPALAQLICFYCDHCYALLLWLQQLRLWRQPRLNMKRVVVPTKWMIRRRGQELRPQETSISVYAKIRINLPFGGISCQRRHPQPRDLPSNRKHRKLVRPYLLS